jgi:succinyl-CoA synthetase beta subunit
MNTHEYQAKAILAKYGIPIPEFFVLSSTEDIEKAISSLGVDQAVVKVQVHAGGRGKAGGVKLARTPEEIRHACRQLLGMRIVNNQTGPEGVIAHQLLIGPLTEYEKEYYVGAVIDREKGKGVLIVSPEGGMDIEEVAQRHPEKIAKIPLSNCGRIHSYDFIRINKLMGWTGDIAKQGKNLLTGLAKAFVETDASLLEINPLVKTKDGQLLALDAKLSVDDNALYRQPEIAAFYDPTQLPENEVRANKYDLAYVALDGTIGCMVNGAGLAMATMDIISHYGGEPANFLDVGGGATQDKVAEGFKIILADPKVSAILVNIFGGIMNCVTLAAGIIAAASELGVNVPLIVRMEGTNVEQGKKMLQEPGLNITIANDLEDAARKAVAAASK